VKSFNKNVSFLTESTSIRQQFIDKLHRYIEREKPDIVWIDPLLSFAGIDVTKQDQCSEFLTRVAKSSPRRHRRRSDWHFITPASQKR
jgi:RecA-family ATPase